ncbi:alpha/beta hydrolase [Rhizobium mongolense]|uniref:Acetyl esterase/lipase n=2 Tax=Rhizobium mongolense TaxID=57676 RepID=A0ABR6IFX1_9HYPH|nr:alpha/beta hydrolase [Rhizobium mongolense]MBB4226754.1 acetyl esterase/lipase [Rhizobium mongolense]TVZ73980.1 acetyl esterase/lipase [Rhizobium mongolense USDA 1844]
MPLRSKTGLAGRAMACLLLVSSPIDMARAEDTTKSDPRSRAKEIIARLLDDKSDFRDRRLRFDEAMSATPEPTRVQIRQVDADGVDGELIWPARLHHPLGRRAILYLHGGGFYGGSMRSHRNIAASFAKASSADVLLIEYRLLPQYRFPRQVEDAVTAFRWLLESGYEAANIVVIGDSVGGTLALQMSLRQIATNGEKPAAVIAISPVADFEGAGVPAHGEDEVSVSREWLQQVGKEYAGKGSPSLQTVSPINSDYSGFPPILLQVGDKEALRGDVQRLFEKLKAANVDVRLDVVPGLFHGASLFPFWLDDARRSNQNAAEFAMAHFADRPPQ